MSKKRGRKEPLTRELLASKQDDELDRLWEQFSTGKTTKPRRKAALVNALMRALEEHSEDEIEVEEEVEEEEEEEEEEADEGEGEGEGEDEGKNENKNFADMSFAELKELGKDHGITGRSKKAIIDQLENQMEVEDNDVANNDDEGDAADAAQYSFADLKYVAKRHKLSGRSKVALLEAIMEHGGIDIDAELAAAQEEEDLPPAQYSEADLLTATMPELKAWAEEMNVDGKKKADLLEGLRSCLPAKERWASSDSDWENISLPGENEYGNIDVREGVPHGLSWIRQKRCGATAKSAHIPYAAALVGFTSYRGQYSPDIDGVLVRKKDKAKLVGHLKLRKVKKQRTADNREKKLSKPKAKPAWSFADLPSKKSRELFRDFTELPRDVWLKIFLFCDAIDVLVCRRVNQGLNRLVTILYSSFNSKCNFLILFRLILRSFGLESYLLIFQSAKSTRHSFEMASRKSCISISRRKSLSIVVIR